MHLPRRLFTVLLLLTLTLGPATTAGADDDDPPRGATNPAASVTAASTVLTGQVHPGGETTYYWFEYGTTTSYGTKTPYVAIQGNAGWSNATATIEGLAPGTVYHFRLRAWNDEGSFAGADQTFTTTAAASPVAPAVPTPSTPAPAEQPAQGTSVVVAPVSGTIKVQTPGAGGFTVLGAGDAVPVGSVVDTRAGTVALTSAVGGGTQTGQFKGAVFQVRQARAGSGMTDLVLRGGDFRACTASGGTARASARRKPPARRLWATDNGGKFRTHGRNSVATVRGTSWVTTDTCAGTRTTVTEGAVAVRDLRRKRTVLVRAGESYLARSGR